MSDTPQSQGKSIMQVFRDAQWATAEALLLTNPTYEQMVADCPAHLCSPTRDLANRLTGGLVSMNTHLGAHDTELGDEY